VVPVPLIGVSMTAALWQPRSSESHTMRRTRDVLERGKLVVHTLRVKQSTSHFMWFCWGEGPANSRSCCVACWRCNCTNCNAEVQLLQRDKGCLCACTLLT
jgi:hypothetical protein